MTALIEWLHTALTQLALSHVAQRIGWALVHFLWQGAAIAGLLWLALRLLARRGPRVRYAVACLALGLMALAPVATFLLCEPSPPRPTTRARKLSTVKSESKPLGREGLPGPETPGAGPAISGPGHQAPLAAVEAGTTAPGQTVGVSVGQSRWERVARWMQPGLPWILAAWLVGVSVCCVLHVGGWWRVQQLRRRATPLGDAGWEGQWVRISRSLTSTVCLSRSLELLKLTGAGAGALAGPVVVGVLRPAVLIPAAVLTGLTPSQVEAVLAHELAHIRRHDYLVNLLQALVEMLLFYHPAVWWASARTRAERENCCDDLAASAVGDSHAYAAALAALAEVAVAQQPARPAGIIGRLAPATRGRRSSADRIAPGAKTNLLSRIRRLLGVDVGSSPRWTAALGGVILLTGLLAGIAFYGCARGTHGPEPTSHGMSSAGEETPPAVEARIVNRIELVDKDDLPAGMFCRVPPYSTSDHPGAKWVYKHTQDAMKRAEAAGLASQDVLVLPELSARLGGIYPDKGTLEIGEQFVQGDTITIRLRYIDEDKDIARPAFKPGNTGYVEGFDGPVEVGAEVNIPPLAVSGKERSKSVYLWGHMPTDLTPGRYTVKLELDEYERKDGQLVFAPRTKIRHHERLSCTFVVSKQAMQPAAMDVRAAVGLLKKTGPIRPVPIVAEGILARQRPGRAIPPIDRSDTAETGTGTGTAIASSLVADAWLVSEDGKAAFAIRLPKDKADILKEIKDGQRVRVQGDGTVFAEGPALLLKSIQVVPSSSSVAALDSSLATLSAQALAEKMVVQRELGLGEFVFVGGVFREKIKGLSAQEREKMIDLFADEVAVLQQGKQWEKRGTLHDRHHLLVCLGELKAREALVEIVQRHSGADCCAAPAMIDALVSCAGKEDAWLLASKFETMGYEDTLFKIHEGLGRLTRLEVKVSRPSGRFDFAKVWADALARAGIGVQGQLQFVWDATTRQIAHMKTDKGFLRYELAIHAEDGTAWSLLPPGRDRWRKLEIRASMSQLSQAVVSPDGKYLVLVTRGEGHPILDVLDWPKAVSGRRVEPGLSVDPYPGWVEIIGPRDGKVAVKSDAPLDDPKWSQTSPARRKLLPKTRVFLLDPASGVFEGAEGKE